MMYKGRFVENVTVTLPGMVNTRFRTAVPANVTIDFKFTDKDGYPSENPEITVTEITEIE